MGFRVNNNVKAHPNNNHVKHELRSFLIIYIRKKKNLHCVAL